MFCACLDGSDHSLKCYDVLKDIVDPKLDTVIAVTVCEGASEKDPQSMEMVDSMRSTHNSFISSFANGDNPGVNR